MIGVHIRETVHVLQRKVSVIKVFISEESYPVRWVSVIREVPVFEKWFACCSGR